MKVTLHTAKGMAKSVTIDCTPLEYILINRILRQYAEINAKDVLMAERMFKDANAIYAEEGEEDEAGD